MFALLMVILNKKEGWRCVWMDCGGVLTPTQGLVGAEVILVINYFDVSYWAFFFFFTQLQQPIIPYSPERL